MESNYNKKSELMHIKNKALLIPPLTVINGQYIKVSEFINNLILFYFDNISSIYDPTCGKENYQFRDRLIMYNNKYYYRLQRNRLVRYIASDIKKTKWNCIDEKCLVVDLLKPPYPFKDEEFDIAIYDPPFLPNPRSDNRGIDYDIKKNELLMKLGNTIRKKYLENSTGLSRRD